jgi:hypothetical protein
VVAVVDGDPSDPQGLSVCLAAILPVQTFLQSLIDAERAPNVFNPWRDRDRAHDIHRDAPSIRRRQLERYVQARRGEARFALIGEALGYQGGHFSGIAMTSERILLGHKRDEGIDPEQIMPGLEPQRTSKSEIKLQGFSEPTATIVWKALLGHGHLATGFVLWNAFPWHPFSTEQGMLSNRKLTSRELAASESTLRRFLSLFPECRLIAVGKVAAERLGALNVTYDAVRHPAQGGASKFRRQMRSILG